MGQYLVISIILLVISIYLLGQLKFNRYSKLIKTIKRIYIFQVYICAILLIIGMIDSYIMYIETNQYYRWWGLSHISSFIATMLIIIFNTLRITYILTNKEKAL